MLKIAIFIIYLSSIQCLNLCGDWIQYKDIICIKVLEKKGTEEEALGNCTQLDQTSTLLTIHSKEEQEFQNNILVKYNNISTFSWIGIIYSDKSYKWIDESAYNYTNWAEDPALDGNEPCAQMSLIGSTLGKWTDENCKKTALIVCQKNQEINFMTIKNIIEKQENDLNILKNQLESVNSKLEISIKDNHVKLIPIGFLYTQLPNTSTPQQLWPSFRWIEVTKDFAGLFLRAEGGDSFPFGQIQHGDNPRITDASSNTFCGIPRSDPKQPRKNNTVFNKGAWTDNIFVDIGGCAPSNLRLFTSNVETRTVNTAVKIWKRTS